jgi:hypothetical protein
MAQLATACSPHAGDSWLQWQPPLLQRLLNCLAAQREQLEVHHVSSVLRDVTQIACLQLQLQKQRGGNGSATVTPTGYGSAGSLPSMGEAGGAGGLEGTSPDRMSAGLGGISASSSTASSSCILGSSMVAQSAPASTASGEDAEDVLARLAASGGPQDASSTVLALTMLRPQLQQLGLQPGVAALCSMLPPAALPHLGPDVGQRLLAAASQPDVPIACSPMSEPLSVKDGMPETPFSLPVSAVFAARVFAQSSEGLPLVPVPLAVPGSVSSSSGGSNAGSPTDPSPLASFGAASPRGLGQMPAGNPGHSNPGHGNPGSPQVAGLPGNPGNPGSVGPAAQAGSTAAPAAAAGEAEGAADSQEEAAARQLTHNIAYADSVFQLADIFTAHASVMDMIHITACITRLSKVLGTSPSQASQAAAASLLPLLGNKLLSVLPNANARGIANVLWGYGRLRALPQVQLLPPLVEAFLQQLPNAACRDSAVVLWSLARLSEGHGEPADTTVPAPLLRRLGREVLQQLSVAAHEGSAPAQPGSEQQRQPGSAGGPAADRGPGEGQGDSGGPPSSRDVSNSLMALARLGFVSEDDTAAAGAGAGAASSGTPTAAADTLAWQVQGLSLTAGAGATAAEGSQTQVLTLPLSLITSVVDYLLRMASTAKTLDLQETATALKQLGLRELHAKVAAMVITHHGATHGGAGAGGMPGQFMQFGGAGSRPGQYHGRVMGPQGPVYGGGQYSGGQYGGIMQQQRRPMSGPMQGGWVPAHQQAGMEGGGYMRPGGGYMPVRQGPAGQVMRQPGFGAQQQQQQQQQPYMFAPAGGVSAGVNRQSLTGYTSLAGAAGGVQTQYYGGSPAGQAAPGYAVQYGSAEQQQQPAGGAYSPGVQYMLLPQQAQQGMGTYVVQQQGQQQQGGEYMSVPVVQQQMPGDQALTGLVGAGAAAGQQQYYYQPTSTPAIIMPGMQVGQEAGSAAVGSGQQLFLPTMQQAQGAGVAALGGLGGQFAAGSGVYQASAGMMMVPGVPDAMTSSAYNASVVGDIFLGGGPQQQQPQGPRSLQMLQQQMQPAGLYQGQAQGYQAQDPGAAAAQLPLLYGVAGQGQQQPQQQQFGAQQGFVLDPTTGTYHHIQQ